MSTVLGRSLALAFGGLVAGLALVLALFGGDLRDRWARTAEPAPRALSASPDSKPGGGASTALPERPSPTERDAPRASETVPAMDSIAAGRAEPGPSFDIVRVEPNGESVVAGRARPDTTVELLVDGKSVAQVRTDRDGQFAIVPPPLAPGSSEIVLRSTDREGREVRSKESVAVALPASGAGKPLVALTAPDRPTQVLSQPEAVSASQAAANPAKPTPLRIVSVDAQENGRLFVSSEAPVGAAVRLYLNDTLIAPAKAGADGKVTFTIGKGVRPGAYRVRVDQVDSETGKVRVRAEVPFTVPEPARIASRTLLENAPQSTANQATATRSDSAKPPQPGSSAQAKWETGRQTAVSAPTAVDPTQARPPAGQTEAAQPFQAAPSSDSARAAAPAGARPGSRREASAEVAQPAPRAPADTPRSNPTAALPAPREQPGRPGESAALTPETAPVSAPQAPGSVFVPEISTARIERGNSLWQISKRTYGRGNRYTVIYDANQEQIRNPDLIYPGQIFVLPEDKDGSGQTGRRRG